MLYMNTNVNLWQYLGEFFSQCEFIRTNGVDKVKTYILCSNFFFFEIRCLVRPWDKTWRSRTCHSRQRGTCPFYGYKHTLRIHNSTSVRRRRRNVQFHVQCFVVCYYSNMTGKYVTCLFVSSEWRIVTWCSIYL